MEKDKLSNIINNPSELTFQDRVLIQDEYSSAPYSALLRILNTLSCKACNISSDKGSNIQIVTLFLPTYNNLQTLIDAVKLKDDKGANTVEPKLVKTPAAAATDNNNGSNEDILKEINNYQEISFKTAPKSVILDKFLETAAYTDTNTAKIEPVEVSEVGKKSIQPDNSIYTETLASVLEKQGKWDKAIEVYKNLSAKHPEKSSIFATRIHELETKLENNKK